MLLLLLLGARTRSDDAYRYRRYQRNVAALPRRQLRQPAHAGEGHGTSLWARPRRRHARTEGNKRSGAELDKPSQAAMTHHCVVSHVLAVRTAAH